MTQQELTDKITELNGKISTLQNQYTEDARSIQEIKENATYKHDVYYGTGSAAAATNYQTSGIHGQTSLNTLSAEMTSISGQISTVTGQRDGYQTQLNLILGAVTATEQSKANEAAATQNAAATKLAEAQAVLKNYANQNTKYIIIGVIAFLVIGSAIFYFFKKKKAAI